MEENQLATDDCEVFVIGGSAGSLTVLFGLLPSLPLSFPFAIIIVLHRKNSGDSSLSDLLSLKSPVPVREIEDKDPIEAGNIYLVPADYHVLIEKNRTFSLDYSEKVNFSRPSLDVTFESTAEIYGPTVTAVILSGANEDGTRGLTAVKKNGGTTIAQNPDSAQMPVMPQHAISQNMVDLILSPEEIANYIQKISGK